MAQAEQTTDENRVALTSYLSFLKRVWDRQSEANLGLLAAGIAFYALLSLFPGITALVAVAGLFLDPSILMEQSERLSTLLPPAASEIILAQLQEVLGADQTALSFAAVFALGIALYSASKAVANFIIGLNEVYEEEEERGFVWLSALKVLLTAALIFGVLFAILIVAAIPIVAGFLGSAFLQDAALLLRWPILLVSAAAGIAILYRYGPDRRAARWRWITPGAALACVLWIAGSIGFSQYVQSFGTYNETFGALGGVIILLTWLWLSSFIILLGALVDAEYEAQTIEDSTVGPVKPRGERGAVKADQLVGANLSQAPAPAK